MKKVKEVTVFTVGDSGKISTWSNVPFFFTETLISKGIKVNRVDISPAQCLCRPFHFMVKIFSRSTSFRYSHSWMNFFLTRAKIKKAVKKFVNSDADIFLTFSFSSAGFTKKPVVQFCDWTYAHYILYFLKREPDFLEKKAIMRENKQILGSDLVFSLFPSVTEDMKTHYGKDRVFYLGNVINSLYDVSVDDIHIKETYHNLLFVGNVKYKEGAKALIAAFRLLKSQYPLLKLHIVGLEENELEQLPEDVFCYGYLDKGIDDDRILYYKLFREATVFVNTTPKWGAFSASTEAMYFYTPVVVTPYEEFLKTFGDTIHFGAYCEENSPALIQRKIAEILNSPSYRELCAQAHEAVKTFTWDAYMDKLIAKIETL
jgi:glycosyltransferase involved in cell wall biosynthesis